MKVPAGLHPRSADLAAALFARLSAQRPEDPAALLDSSDHHSSPAPARSRYSILAFSSGPELSLIHI